ncbi:MAG: peptide chain release factor N(5)-glutamine methyltransferase [Bifidobacteriaceae bacterium]|nr:peptide chain release factor N(5)-glutamine methyltransferase [Bifidobacteriaceae bacterium]
MILVEQVLHEAAIKLKQAGVRTPEHDATLLLAHTVQGELSDIRKAQIMQESLLKLYSRTHEGLELEQNTQDFENSVYEQYKQYIALRSTRKPLQHITGSVTFRNISLQVGSGVFIPRQETEEVAQTGIDFIREHNIVNPLIVDLCAGSGAIGLSMLTEIPYSTVWAVEYSDKAIEYTVRNRDLIYAAFPSCKNAYHLIQADATEPTILPQLHNKVDLVMCNPPYIPQSQIPEQIEVSVFDPPIALYGGSDDGLLIPRQIIKVAAKLLRPGGMLVMEHDISQSDNLVEYAQQCEFSQVRAHVDLTQRPRYISAIK